jgi:hypothetical protein
MALFPPQNLSLADCARGHSAGVGERSECDIVVTAVECRLFVRI